MTVTAVNKDPQNLTLKLDAEFDAPPERVWELWSDPRQLERWWGPPTYPATPTAGPVASVSTPERRRSSVAPRSRATPRPPRSCGR